MKLPKSVLVMAFALCSGLRILAADGGAAVLQIQKAPAASGPWQVLPASPLSLTPEGGLSDPQTNSAFYRLQINTTDVAGGALGIPLSTVSPQALQQAQTMLSGNTGMGWGGSASLAPYAYPVYDPSINLGKDPAYLEFKVIAGSNGPAGQFTSPPLEPATALGYILVSLTTQDIPVPEMAQNGPTRVEQLRVLAQASNVRIFRYGHGLWVAEDSTGNPVATLGSMPYRLSGQIPSLTGAALGGQVISNTVVSDTGPIQGTDYGPYNSYNDFKQDYTTGPVYSFIHARRAEAGQFRWDLESGTLPPIIAVPLGTATQILSGLQITAFDLEDPTIASAKILAAAPGLNVTGLTVGGTILHVLLSSGTTAYYALQVSVNPSPYHTLGICDGWTPWQYWWAGGCGDERQYQQVWNLGGCNAGCWSGCGPTAWAMLYGWWDNRGLCTLIGGCTPTPMFNDVNVNACISALCGWLSPFCAFGQGATTPWNEPNGWRWAPGRGHGISESWTWGVPYFCGGCGGQAQAAIQSGRPAIVGTGVYYHYPLAWGYAYREYHCFGVTWTHSAYWATNQGQGAAPCPIVWASTDDCWFGNNTTVY
jgi:hypothetical protein